MANNPYSKGYKFNFITVLPPEFILVTRNPWTRNVGDANTFFGVSKLFGLEGVIITWFPWLKSKFLPARSQADDIPEKNYITKDRVSLTVDIAIEKRIVDSGKYETVTGTIEQTLKNYIDGAVRGAIINYTVDEILDSSFDLNALIRNQLDDFEKMYGLRVESVIMQNFRLPDNIVKSMEKKYATEADTEVIRKTGQANADVQEKMNKIEIDKKRAEAGVAVSAEKARNENEINQMNQLLQLIKNCGPEEFEQLSKLAYPMLLNNSGNRHLFVQNSGDSTNAIMAATAEEGKPKTR